MIAANAALKIFDLEGTYSTFTVQDILIDYVVDNSCVAEILFLIFLVG